MVNLKVPIRGLAEPPCPFIVECLAWIGSFKVRTHTASDNGLVVIASAFIAGGVTLIGVGHIKRRI